MRVLVLWADASSTNLGVQVLAAGSAALARMSWPDAEVSYLTYGSQEGPMRVGNPRALARELMFPRRGLVEWLRGFDLVLDTRGGDSFSDIYGLDRHVTMGLLAEAVQRAGVPYVLGPQTIGPFGSRRARLLAQRSLRLSRLAMARDPMSSEVAEGLGRPVDLLTSDVVFALPQPLLAESYDVMLNISGLLWQPGPHVDAVQYRQLVRGLYAALVGAGRRVTLLAHVIDSPVPDNDVPAVQSFAEEVGTDDVFIPGSLSEARSAIAGARAVVGSRMHACLNALSVGVPAVALAYSHKFEPLLSQLDWHEVIDLRNTVTALDDVVGRLEAPGLSDRACRARETGQRLIARAALELSAVQ